jgi:hypothetical protein
MKILRIALLIFVSLLIAACGNNGDEFIGTWTNNSESSGDGFRITIERNGENFIITGKIQPNGALHTRESGKLVDGNMLVENGRLFGKLAYSKQDDSILPLNTIVPLPAFKRVK